MIIMNDSRIQKPIVEWESISHLTPGLALRFYESFREALTSYSEYVFKFSRYEDDLGHDMTECCINILRSFIDELQIIIWKDEMWQAAVAGCYDTFNGTKIENFTNEEDGAKFWLFDFCFTPDDGMLGLLDLDRTFLCNNIILIRIEDPYKEFDHIVPIFIFTKHPDIGSITPKVWSDVIPRIRIAPPLTAGESINAEIQAELIAAMKFIKLPFVAEELTNPVRYERRQYEKKNNKKAPLIKTVILRKKESNNENKYTEHKNIEWNCQWIVGAHWRKQYYKSINDHKPVYIDSFVKGPSNKPLKPPTKTIYKVVR
jgi:hypothetical protein